MVREQPEIHERTNLQSDEEAVDEGAWEVVTTEGREIQWVVEEDGGYAKNKQLALEQSRGPGPAKS